MSFTFRNKEFGKQLLIFEHLPMGAINIDGLMDIHGKGWIILEAKTNGSPLPFGQRVALERLCDDLSQVKPTILIIAEHEAIDGDIDLASCKVRCVRWNKQYNLTEKNVEQFISEFIKKVDK